MTLPSTRAYYLYLFSVAVHKIPMVYLVLQIKSNKTWYLDKGRSHEAGMNTKISDMDTYMQLAFNLLFVHHTWFILGLVGPLASLF